MNNYCVDLEIAKKLKVKGFPQFVNFYYRPMAQNKYICTYKNEDTIENCDIATPTSDELLKELPTTIGSCIFNMYRGIITPDYYVGYWNDSGYNDNGKDNVKQFNDEKLSNALAKLWIYLKKEKLINEL